MTRQEKLRKKLCESPRTVRFSEVQRLLQQEGFVLFNQRGSHCTYHRADGMLLTIVRPHGNRKACYSEDIKKLTRVLKLC